MTIDGTPIQQQFQSQLILVLVVGGRVGAGVHLVGSPDGPFVVVHPQRLQIDGEQRRHVHRGRVGDRRRHYGIPPGVQLQSRVGSRLRQVGHALGLDALEVDVAALGLLLLPGHVNEGALHVVVDHFGSAPRTLLHLFLVGRIAWKNAETSASPPSSLLLPSIPKRIFFRPRSLSTCLATSLFSMYLKNLYMAVLLTVWLYSSPIWGGYWSSQSTVSSSRRTTMWHSRSPLWAELTISGRISSSRKTSNWQRAPSLESSCSRPPGAQTQILSRSRC
jgi:hypothetical protein